jgi:hypothetical protein
MSTVMESLKDKLGVVIVTAAVSLATVFSDKIVGSIKSEVNKADQRPAEEQLIAMDISLFIFCAENVLEYLAKNQTTKKELEFVNPPYNDAITSLRKNEYVYLAAIQRYWDKPVVQQYETFFADVRSVDKAIHDFNDEFAAIDAGTKQKADEAAIKSRVSAASDAVAELEKSSKLLLTTLSQ